MNIPDTIPLSEVQNEWVRETLQHAEVQLRNHYATETSLAPFLFVFKAGAEDRFSGIGIDVQDFMSSDDGKDALAERVRALVSRTDLVSAVLFASEAWTVQRKNGEEFYVPPSECDDRIEVVFLTMNTADSQTICMIPILRDDDGVTLGELRVISGRAEGRFGRAEGSVVH
jgi:hypothetical protein